mmetsp:Transcript_2955/g.8788  ORF Transcript_2955/g.8788 Transcript_2955/m.8788 type:complete len:262 (-) Transcript_2955:3534-4319(-)
MTGTWQRSSRKRAVEPSMRWRADSLAWTGWPAMQRLKTSRRRWRWWSVTPKKRWSAPIARVSRGWAVARWPRAAIWVFGSRYASTIGRRRAYLHRPSLSDGSFAPKRSGSSGSSTRACARDRHMTSNRPSNSSSTMTRRLRCVSLPMGPGGTTQPTPPRPGVSTAAQGSGAAGRARSGFCSACALPSLRWPQLRAPSIRTSSRHSPSASIPCRSRPATTYLSTRSSDGKIGSWRAGMRRRLAAHGSATSLPGGSTTRRWLS